ncbi:hypothetical protein [Salinarimonas sp.]|uniref:hypothetical protein n=1 Tax=Salinarimonas sp. TaxID=2766526 RepID=UPI0032D8E354
MLVDLGVPVDDDVRAIWVNGESYSLPLTSNARARLEAAGYAKREITPSIDGRVHPPVPTSLPR